MDKARWEMLKLTQTLGHGETQCTDSVERPQISQVREGTSIDVEAHGSLGGTDAAISQRISTFAVAARPASNIHAN